MKDVLEGLLKKMLVDQRMDERVLMEVVVKIIEGLLRVVEEHNGLLLFDHGDLTLCTFNFIDIDPCESFSYTKRLSR